MGDLIGLIVFMIIVSSIIRNIAEKFKGPADGKSGGDLDGSSLEEQLKRLLGESEPESRQPSRPQSPSTQRPSMQRPTVHPTRTTPPPVAPPPVRRPASPPPRTVTPPRAPAYEAQPQSKSQPQPQPVRREAAPASRQPAPPLPQPARQRAASAQPMMAAATADDSLRQDMVERQRKIQAASEPRKFTKPLEARPYARKKAARMRKKFKLSPKILAQGIVLSEIIQPPLALRKPE